MIERLFCFYKRKTDERRSSSEVFLKTNLMHPGTTKITQSKRNQRPKKTTYKMIHIMRNDRFLSRPSVLPKSNLKKHTDWHLGKISSKDAGYVMGGV
jgi:hypothetical protein